MRTRIAVSLAALALVFILTQSLALVLMLERNEDEFITAQLTAQIEYSMDLWRKSPDAALPNAPDMWLYRIAQGASKSNVPLGFASLGVGNHEVLRWQHGVSRCSPRSGWCPLHTGLRC